MNVGLQLGLKFWLLQQLVELDDWDLDENMLWCRFTKRPPYDRRQSYFHFYFFGAVDYYSPQRK